jgi:hypothetical protein
MMNELKGNFLFSEISELVSKCETRNQLNGIMIDVFKEYDIEHLKSENISELFYIVKKESKVLLYLVQIFFNNEKLEGIYVNRQGGPENFERKLGEKLKGIALDIITQGSGDKEKKLYPLGKYQVTSTKVIGLVWMEMHTSERTRRDWLIYQIFINKTSPAINPSP